MKHPIVAVWLAAILPLAALSGCGVKSVPVAPGSSGESRVLDRNGDVERLGAPDNGVPGAQPGDIPDVSYVGTPATTADETSAPSVARGPTITQADQSHTVNSAEVTRNPDAKRKSFFLDPLLN